MNDSGHTLVLIIYDMLGNEIKIQPFAKGEIINVEDLPNGCYFYHVTDTDNYVGSGKIVKL